MPSALRMRHPASLLWAVWAASFALVWILPTRTPPWPTFYAEALMAACLLVAAAGVLCSGSGPPHSKHFVIDWAILALFSLATVPLFHGAFGLLVFPDEALLQCLYLVAFAMTYFISRSAWDRMSAGLIDRLWAGLVIASLISAGLAIYQWLRIDTLGWLVSPVGILGRSDANVGQPNNLATLLCWGLVGLWWGLFRSKLGGFVTVFGAAFLLVGIALTQSRTAWLMLAVFPVVLFLGHKALKGPSNWPAVLGLAVWFLSVQWALSAVGEAIQASGLRDLSEQLNVGTRPMIWQLAFDAIAARPWSGFGWNQFLVARVDLIGQYPAHPEIVSYAHNLLLDLLVWGGVIIGGTVFAGLVWWLWGQAHGAQTAEQWLLLAGLGVLLVHAMLELPHAYAYFLLPAAAMAGTLAAMNPVAAFASVPRWSVGVGLFAMAASLVLLISEYGQIEAGDQRRRIAEAGIASRGSSAVGGPLVLLRFVSEAEKLLRQRPSKGMRPEELTRWHEALTRYPVASSLARFAQAAAVNGQFEESLWALSVLCGLYGRQTCEAAATELAEFTAQHAEASSVAEPTSPR